MYAHAQSAPETQEPAGPSARFRPALEVWGHVQSRPEPGLAILALGKRDISHDIEPPRPIHWVRRGQRIIEPLDDRFRIVAMNDQHASMVIPTSHRLAIGDLVAVGCSHPCTTFDKWRTILVVDDDYAVIDAIATCF